MHLHKGIQSACSQKGTICRVVWRQHSVCVEELTKMIFWKKKQKTAELWMWAHWCVKSHLIKAGKRLQQWTVPVHLIKSTCTWEGWGVCGGGGAGKWKAKQTAAARSLLSFSLDANQRLDLGAGQASGTSLCLADPGNLLPIIPPVPPSLCTPRTPATHLT